MGRSAVFETILRITSVLAISFSFAAGCSSSSDKGHLAASCKLNSDCDTGLVCTFGLCHAECVASRDCSAGERCVSSGTNNVCELDSEATCGGAAACHSPLVCAVDGQCRNPCDTNANCIKGQTCATTGVCADGTEVNPSGDLKYAPDSGSPGAGGTSGSGGTTSTGGATSGGGTGAVDAGGPDGAPTGGAGSGGSPVDAGPKITCGADFDHAVPLTLGVPISATLANVSTTACYYKFTGTKLERVHLFTNAKPVDQSFAPQFVDTVVTLFDPSRHQIARNDDDITQQTNDSRLFSVLPETGTFYVIVDDCNLANGGGPNCTSPSDITNHDFQVEADVVTPTTPGVTTEGVEPDDTVSNATDVRYDPGQGAGSYLLSTISGEFDTATDVDVYVVKSELDIPIYMGARPTLTVIVDPPGSTGNGPSGPVGAMWLTDSATPTTVYAKTSAYTQTLRAPVVAGHDYYLFVAHDAQAPLGAYFISTYGGPGDGVEKEPNDTSAQYDTLASLSTAPSKLFAVDGDVSTTKDVDWFEMDTSGTTALTVNCLSSNFGSGLQNFSVTLYAADATTPIPGGSATEALDPGGSPDISLSNVSVAGRNSVFAKVSALGHSATVSGSYYQCVFEGS